MNVPRGWYGNLKSLLPGQRIWVGVVGRCRSKKSNYYRRGIRCLITPDEIQRLWDRDGARRLFRPVLDRVDPNWHYHISNCRFITNSDNISRVRYIPTTGRGDMKDRLIRISGPVANAVEKVAAKEGRSIKSQIERFLVTALALYADQEMQLNRNKKIAK